jgi:hypothetical protein
MTNATFRIEDETLKMLRELIPKRKMSNFVNETIKKKLIVESRKKAMEMAEEMRKIAKKHNLGSSKETIEYIRKMRESR